MAAPVMPPAARRGRRVLPVAKAAGGDSTGSREGSAGSGEKALARLASALQRCRECPLGACATQAVAGEGPLRARLMLVGEQPGNDEDLQGRPFVGPAGRLLDRALDDLGWPRRRLFVTNAVKHFKYELRGKRRLHKTPAQREADACHHWLADEIEIVQPAALIALGATAAKALLGPRAAVLRDRGRWQVAEDGRKVIVTLHPSAILRAMRDDPAAYPRWIDDLKAASAFLRPGPATNTH